MNEQENTLLELKKRIISARKLAGLSVEAAAIKMGMSRVQMWRLENKPNPPLSVAKLLEMAKLYNVDAASLLQGSIDASPPEIAYERIRRVILLVEEVVQEKNMRPTPESFAAMVIEILKLEANRLSESPNSTFNPEAYVGLIQIDKPG